MFLKGIQSDNQLKSLLVKASFLLQPFLPLPSPPPLHPLPSVQQVIEMAQL